jgi:hypothetical protein
MVGKEIGVGYGRAAIVDRAYCCELSVVPPAECMP